MIDARDLLAQIAMGIPADQLPEAIIRATALLRAEGIDVTAKARSIIRQLPSMRAYAPLLMSDEERINEIYDRLHHVRSTEEEAELLRELRRLQKIEADRFMEVAESRAVFHPNEAMVAIAGAHKLATRHAPALDDETSKHHD